MKVKVLISFVGFDGSGTKHRLNEGDEIELPFGTDWVKAGFVEPIEAEAPANRKKTAASKSAGERETR